MEVRARSNVDWLISVLMNFVQHFDGVGVALSQLVLGHHQSVLLIDPSVVQIEGYESGSITMLTVEENVEFDSHVPKPDFSPWFLNLQKSTVHSWHQIHGSQLVASEGACTWDPVKVDGSMWRDFDGGFCADRHAVDEERPWAPSSVAW